MFNDKYGLTSAVLDGRKTMTRRIAWEINHPLIIEYTDWKRDSKGKAYVTATYQTGLTVDVYPPHQHGEVVAIAQSYKHAGIEVGQIVGHIDEGQNMYTPVTAIESKGWKNKMFVRADLMPYQCVVTNLRIERLQDISDEDAMREGVFKYDKPPLFHEADMFAPWAPYVRPYKRDSDNLVYRCTARYAFAYLIDKICGKGTWERNPLVYVEEFELIK